MAHTIRMARSRLTEILRRQDPPQFGAGYEPSIKATREEAPSISRPALVWSELLSRFVHTLSDAETAVLCIILYCYFLFELHEQRMLPYLPSVHPLVGHPLAAGLVLPTLRGTLAISDELGFFHFHPFLRADSENSVAPPEQEPAPWIGDFLLFLLDEQGPYCTNLSVKSTRIEFSDRQVGVTPKTNRARAKRRSSARHEVERILFAEAGIPTHFVAADEIDPIVVANLKELLLWQKRKHPFAEDQRLKIEESLADGIVLGKSALEILKNFAQAHDYRLYDTKIVMYHAIWHRRLRIDLFQYFFIEQPLIPESLDVLDVYRLWFARP